MKNFLLFIVSILLLSCSEQRVVERYFSAHTTRVNRENFFKELTQKMIENNLLKELNDSTEDDYMSAFWGMELSGYRSDMTLTAIKNSFSNFKNNSDSFNRALLEVVYTLYPTEFNVEIANYGLSSSNSKLFAMSVYYLLRNFPENISIYENLMENNYPDYKEDPILYFMSENKFTDTENKLPDLSKLLFHNFSNKPIIFSFQRKDRDFHGLILLRDISGKFINNPDGTIFTSPQLARAVTNLPGTITNGNTPQGIFSFQGFGKSDNSFIGPVPNLHLVLPFEVNPIKYFHQTVNDTNWRKDLYKNLLPDEWREYYQIFEAYYAGKAGRNEIIAHGTTIDPKFYEGKTYYPNSPSLGCLTSLELWSPDNGELIYSDQLRLYNTLKKNNIEDGFFIVIELDDRKESVSLRDILPYLENNILVHLSCLPNLKNRLLHLAQASVL